MRKHVLLCDGCGVVMATSQGEPEAPATAIIVGPILFYNLNEANGTRAMLEFCSKNCVRAHLLSLIEKKIDESASPEDPQ